MWKMNTLGCMSYVPVTVYRISVTVADSDSLLFVSYDFYEKHRD